MTKNRTSRIGTRSAISFIASRIGRPKFWRSKVVSKLLPDRSRQFVGDHAERRLERVTGADRPRYQVERLRKLLSRILARRVERRRSSHAKGALGR